MLTSFVVQFINLFQRNLICRALERDLQTRFLAFDNVHAVEFSRIGRSCLGPSRAEFRATVLTYQKQGFSSNQGRGEKARNSLDSRAAFGMRVLPDSPAFGCPSFGAEDELLEAEFLSNHAPLGLQDSNIVGIRGHCKSGQKTGASG